MSVLVSLHGGVNMRKWISWRLCCVDMRTTRLVTLSNLERPNTRTSTPSHEFGPTNHNLNAHYTPISLTTSTPWCHFIIGPNSGLLTIAQLPQSSIHEKKMCQRNISRKGVMSLNS
jgi:hypothetical protein